MKYIGRYWYILSFLLKKPLSKCCGRKAAGKYIKEAAAIYKQMLAETEDIGADNPMAGNLYMCYVFLAIYRASKGGISIDDMRSVVGEFMRSKAVSMSMGGMDINKAEDMQKLYATFKRMAQWAEDHPEYKDKTWDFNFDETLHNTGIYYHFTRCPLEKYCREHGLLDVLPIMCDIDHMNARLKHGILHREQTLASGGDKCDYWFVGDRS